MNRDFKGVWIPKEVWLNRDLSIMEKLFLVEIDSLDGSKSCFASNAHFAEFFGISKGRCTQIIKSLEAKGFLKITLIKKGKLVQKRLIKVVNKLNRVVNKLNQGSEKIKSGYLENDEGSNTSNSNTKEKVETKPPTPETPVAIVVPKNPPIPDIELRVGMTFEWMPSRNIIGLAQLTGLSNFEALDTKENRGEFISYWLTKKQSGVPVCRFNSEWDHAYIKQLKRINSLPTKNAEIDFDSTGWSTKNYG